jgi:hypothetical protein
LQVTIRNKEVRGTIWIICMNKPVINFMVRISSGQLAISVLCPYYFTERDSSANQSENLI